MQAWRTRALVIGAALSFLAALVASLPVSSLWSWQEALDLHLLFRARGPRPAPPDVVLVPIDGRAARSLFLPAAAEAFERCADLRFDPAPGYRNPDPPDILTRWPPCLHAMALEALAVAQPDLIVVLVRKIRPQVLPSGARAPTTATTVARVFGARCR